MCDNLRVMGSQQIQHYFVQFSEPIPVHNWLRMVDRLQAYLRAHRIYLDDFDACCEVCVRRQQRQDVVDFMEGFVRGNTNRWRQRFASYFANEGIDVTEIRS